MLYIAFNSQNVAQSNGYEMNPSQINNNYNHNNSYNCNVDISSSLTNSGIYAQ